MLVRKEKPFEELAGEMIARNWKLVVLLVWLGFFAWFIWQNFDAIRWFRLGDTDDNMRMMQVRGLLHGQGWFDLRQYHLNPPFGANIHWSRLVDLPIAGLILALRPFLGGPAAERWAVGIAPLLPYALLLFSVALTARRLIDPRAYPLPLVAMFFAGSTNSMFTPERIDHHGWQLALLALSVSSLTDRRRVRGGVTLAVSSALSLAIGLEMIIYLAIAGAAVVLFWVIDPAQRERLRAYAVTLSASVALGFLLFASYDNRAPVCDALSPVWLSDLLLSGALMYGLTLVPVADWKARFALAAGAGLVIAGFHALTWPHCTQRLEGISPEADRLWMSHVKEARPVYRHGWRTATQIAALPVTGLIGWGLLAWLSRKDGPQFRRVLAGMAPLVAATLLLLWQTRTGPAAQMMGAVGAAALTWFALPAVWRLKPVPLAVLGAVLVSVVGAGASAQFVWQFVPDSPPTPRDRAIGKANALCASMWGLRPVAMQPKGVVFTFVDLGPRLITVTHHDAIAGPYHRNYQQIVDIMNAFRGSEPQAHRLIAKYHSDYLLTCPHSSTTTIFESEAPGGFYTQLEAGKVPAWLQRVSLPWDSPYKMWRVVG